MIILSDDYRNDKTGENRSGFSPESNEIDDFFAQFDEIAEGLSKDNPTDSSNINSTSDAGAHAGSASEDSVGTDILKEEAISEFLNSPDAPRRKTRSERLAEEKEQRKNKNKFAGMASDLTAKGEVIFSKISRKAKEEFLVNDGETADDAENSAATSSMTGKKRRKKKYKLNVKKLIRLFACIFLVMVLIVGGYAAVVIAKAPEINPDNIYSMLSESSVLYDSNGNIIATVGSGETRTNIEYEELPENLVNAFIAIEDKTFWDHNGFNFIRIFGAIKDAVVTGGQISGTSTITQQLARNVYLTETREVRSIERKIAEAYYSVLIENALSKELIIEAYLNTINLGFDSYGVQTAAQSYFSKDVSELDLIECVALASLPKAPSSYALIKKYNPEDVDPEKDIVIYEGSDYTYIYNGDASENRRKQTLKNMYDQGMITAEERDAALAENLLDHINPNISSLTEISSYFSDYAIEQVIQDYADENRIDYDEAREKVYTGGLQIYTTMDSNIQRIVDAEFSNNANFPGVTHLSKDAAGNILGKNGSLLLYNYSNFFDSEGRFYFAPDEYEWLPNGDLKLLAGKRLNFYQTSVQGGTDVSIEFKNLYIVENDVFYSIQGGTILIPQQYKSRDNDKNAIISAEMFDSDDYANYIRKDENGNLFVDAQHYSLRQRVVQPQSAMVIVEYQTGQIKAMAGGRNTVGVKLFNRAVNPRQPGSSIKPITTYGAALQQSVEIMNGGSTPSFVTYDNGGNEVANSYGTYFTAASVIDDSPMISGGRQWPKNWYSGFRGLYTLRTSVQQSVNVNAVKVVQQVGVEYAADYGEKLGITSIVRDGDTNDMNAAALALGGMSKGVSPLEMAGAYGVYPNGGKYVEPVIYTHVTNKHGETILEKVPHTEDVIDPGVAFIMTDILRSVVTEGLGSGAALSNQPVGGKTGTTTDNYDAWFVGFTPQYSAAVWIGNDVNIELTRGSASATAVWKKIMSQVCANIPTGTFLSQPENVTAVEIDTKSGLLPTDMSRMDARGTLRWEYFVKGTEPTEYDNVHKSVNACSYTGYLATPLCPSTYSRFGVMRPYAANPVVGDIEYELPHYYCQLHNPDVSKYPIDPAHGGSGASVGGDDIITADPDDLIDPDITDPPVVDSNPWSGDPSGTATDPSTQPSVPPASDSGNQGGGQTTQQPQTPTQPPVVEQEPPDWL